MHWKESWEFGVEQEKIILPILKKQFGDDLELSKDRYAKYDAYNDQYCVEIKSRTCEYNKYPTTLLTCNKIHVTDRQMIFVFNFTDGIYYIKYNDEGFKKYFKKAYSRSKLSFDYKLYYFIPIEELIKLNN